MDLGMHRNQGKLIVASFNLRFFFFNLLQSFNASANSSKKVVKSQDRKRKQKFCCTFQLSSSSCCSSLFQIFYDQESEVLLSHNCSSHVQKVEVRAAKTHPIEWNSVPLAVVCAFPYILAFSTDAIEFRYAVNGSLLQTLGMPELQLITAKVLKHTILKVKFLSKNSNLTKKNNIFTIFSPKFF